MRATSPDERFQSILFANPGDSGGADARPEPPCFRDLNLDQVVAAIKAGRDEYNLQPFFYAPLTNVAAIEYRHDIMRDLERKALFQSIKAFSNRLRDMRQLLSASEKSHYKYQKERWHLNAVAVYCNATATLLRDLRRLNPASRGLRGFLCFLTEYTASVPFTALRQETEQLLAGLSGIRYNLLICDGRVTVSPGAGERDYSADVEAAFAKFKQGAPRDYLLEYRPASGMNHVAAAVLEFVARLNPDVFTPLLAFCERHKDFVAQTVADFDREIQFYIAWIEYADRFKQAGLKFCYPRMLDDCKNVSSRAGFDLALAGKLVQEHKAVVCNDFALNGSERVCVVTGPNQGGKTTFARTFGQLHHLACLGLPVPGIEAQLFLGDHLFTHFERLEDITNLRGKLRDDLDRIRHIFDQATPNSVIIMNEVFSSTTIKDAVYLSKQIMARILQSDLLCVWVTFLDELASFDNRIVSLVAAVAPDNPTRRTYKIERKPADGCAYALAIAAQYGLTPARIQERIRR